MKVGVIIDFEDQPTEGGAHSYMSLFLCKLLSSNTNFIIISDFSKQYIKERYKVSDKISVCTLNKKEKLRLWMLKLVTATFRKLKLSFALQMFFEDQQKKVYFSSFTRSGVQALLYLPYNKIYTLDIPFFYVLWDLGHRNINVFKEVSGGGRFAYREKVYSEVLPRAYKVVAETNAGKKDIEYYYRIKPEKVLVAPIFAGDVINHSYDQADALAFFNTNKITVGSYLFYPAQFWAHKNHINLLYAFKEILKLKPDLQLVLSGGEKNNLEYVKTKIKELQLEKEVKFLGFVNDLKYIRALYENALALVMPTFLGPSNMPILEAMALGCPVICSDFEGHRELGGADLLYVQPEEPDSIVRAVELLLQNPQLRQTMAQNARHYYLNSNNQVEYGITILTAEFERLERIIRCWK
jgi:glycosyltransferase involved in cell wall biosynthesis